VSKKDLLRWVILPMIALAIIGGIIEPKEEECDSNSGEYSQC